MLEGKVPAGPIDKKWDEYRFPHEAGEPGQPTEARRS